MPGADPLASFVADVWEPRAKRRLATKTWERDAAIYNKHILIELGERPLAQLDAEDLVEWQDKLERGGVGAPTIIKAMSILSSVFREAGRRSRSTGVTRNPVVLLDRPSAKRRRRPLVWGPVVVERVRYELLVRTPLLAPLRADFAALRERSGDGPDDYVFRTPRGGHWVETDWRNFRSCHFVPALERVEADWKKWRSSLARPDEVRESVDELAATRPYDLGRHTHSAPMLASGISLQRLARIQGYSIRVLDETYSEELAEFQDRAERIDPIEEIEIARRLVWGQGQAKHQ